MESDPRSVSAGGISPPEPPPPSHRHYPPDGVDATTFPDLLDAYLYVWPEAGVEAFAPRWGSTRAYADHLLRVAHRVAAGFPHLDVWEYLECALKHGMKWYDAKKGPFDKLFARVLRDRLRKAAAREMVKDGRRRLAERAYAVTRSGRVDGDEPDATFSRWARVLLRRALPVLDPATRCYVTMRLEGEPVAAVAHALGETEQALKNRYGGQKLVRKARAAVRHLVLGLPDRQRRVLVRHLLVEAGLTAEQVGRLLQVPVAVDETVPVIEEEQLLVVLGWKEAPDEFFSGRGGNNALRTGVRVVDADPE